MPLILSIETSTKTCSVALSKGGELVNCIRKKDDTYSHSERLHLYISELFEGSDYVLGDLDAVAVSKGPGSYTGLRIGVSAAKGIAFALDIPLIGVDTLKAICLEYTGDLPDIFIPVMDARRQEVFYGVYNALYQKEHKVDFHVLTEDSFQEFIQGKSVVFIGNGVEKVKSTLQIEGQRVHFVEEDPFSGKHIANLAYHKFLKDDMEDTAYFEPFYLKDFIAGKKKVPANTN